MARFGMGQSKTMKKFDDKTVVVTGGASGIGHVIASLFAEEGAAVGILDVQDKEGEENAQTLRENGSKACYAHADITNYEEISEAIKTVNNELGDIDILVNNAAMVAGESFEDTSLEDWERNINVNLLGTYKVTHAVLPQFKARRKGNIILISSVNALMALGNPAYSVAKAGVISLGQQLATAYAGQGIRTNTIIPGSIHTPAWDFRAVERPEVFDVVKSWYPAGELGKPADIAHAALFLASDETTFINGACLVVDGGLTAGNHRMIKDIIGN
jgi:NAD(P)-dependent dehydrogenase (short-subunit alcohol dehydrogenase family)